MSDDLARALFLVSSKAGAALSSLEEEDLTETNRINIINRLRRTYSAEQTRAILQLALLRQRAKKKFPQALKMFFTPEALEQASDPVISKYRASFIDNNFPPGPILDLGCGIGGDSLALAKKRQVIAIERDPSKLLFAQTNAEVLGVSRNITFVHADWVELMRKGKLPEAAAAFVDPSRRNSRGKRLFGLDKMQPPLQLILELVEICRHVVVKVYPGVRDDELPPRCSVEFISSKGICKEAVLCFTNPSLSPPRKAAVHRDNRWYEINGSGTAVPLGPLKPGMYLYEPDPALIRAQALYELSTTLKAHLFDPQTAYLVSPSLTLTPLADCFQIIEIHRFKLKKLNECINRLQFSRIEIKRRNSAIDPNRLRSKLKPPSRGNDGVIILTRRHNTKLMLLAHRITITNKLCNPKHTFIK